jgi:Ca2+-binding RTX toxin-like protein
MFTSSKSLHSVLRRSLAAFIPARAGTRRRRRTRARGIEALEIRRLLTGDFEWVKTFGAAENDNAADVATDSSGNIFTTGGFERTVDFDPGAGTTFLTAAGLATNAWITRSDSGGNLVWAKALIGTQSFAHSISVDSAGSVLVAGHFSGTVDFDPGSGTASRTSAGGSDAFVLKLSSSGNLQWVRTFGSATNEFALDMAVDSADRVYLAGWFSGTVDFDPGSGNSNTSTVDAFDGYLLSLTSAGGFGWVRTNFLPGTSDEVNRIAVAGDRVHALATTFGETSNDDLSIAAFDRETGGTVYNRRFGATSTVTVAGIVANADSSVILAGHLGRQSEESDSDPPYRISLDGFSVAAAQGANAGFLVKLNAGGTTEWARTMPGQRMHFSSLAQADDGDVYIGGTIRNAMDADPGPGVAAVSGQGTKDPFVAVYTVNGDLRWVRSAAAAGAGLSFVGGLAIQPSGNVVVVGGFDGTVEFSPDGSADRTSTGVLNTQDVFTWVLSPDLKYTLGAGLSGDILLKRNGSRLEMWYNGTLTFGQYILLKDGFVDGTRMVRITDNSSVNSLTVDYQSGGGFGIRSGIHFNAMSSNDSINVLGNGNDGITFAPDFRTARTGSLSAYNGEISFAPVPTLSISHFQHLSVEPQGSTDAVTVTTVAGEAKSMIAGTTEGAAISALTFDGIRDLTINTGVHDGLLAQSNDSVHFNAGSYESLGLKNVFVRTGKGSDVLTVNGPNIALPVDDGAFWFIGGPGTDRIAAIGDTNWDVNDARLVSGGGGRLLLSDIEQSSLTGGTGKNHLNASLFNGDVTLDGVANNDLLRGGSGNDTIFGGLGNDRILGGPGDDTIYGQDGLDQLWGEAGEDSLHGSAGNDQLWGGDDNDWLSGDAGDDWLSGGNGNDTLLGGTNNDVLAGDAGADILNGGGGIDLFDLPGTANAEDLQLQRVSATNAWFKRKPRGLVSVLEQDTLTMDAIDEFLISALDGDDLITVDALFTQLGSVDGGNGTDTCTAPAAWTKVSC